MSRKLDVAIAHTLRDKFAYEFDIPDYSTNGDAMLELIVELTQRTKRGSMMKFYRCPHCSELQSACDFNNAMIVLEQYTFLHRDINIYPALLTGWWTRCPLCKNKIDHKDLLEEYPPLIDRYNSFVRSLEKEDSQLSNLKE